MDPITIGLAVASLAGSVMGAAGQREELKEQEQTALLNARIAEKEAANIREAGKLELFKMRKERDRTLGSQIASFASSGLMFAGSQVDVYKNSYFNAELDILTQEFNTNIEANRALDRASISRKQSGDLGRDAKVKPMLTLLSGVSSAATKIF